MTVVYIINMKNKPIKESVRINTLSIQRRIYPVLLDKVSEIAKETNTTPTKVAAGLLCKQLCLPDPVRKNATKIKETD